MKSILHTTLNGIFVSLFFLSSTTFANIIYVNQSAAGANNGSSWANAFTNLNSALAAASSGDEIWVAQGVYKPSVQVDVNGSGGADAREVTFHIPSGVSVYGGFIGSEATREERNFSINLTILSGDIDNNDVNADANSIAETTSDLVGNNAYHVVYTANVSAATQLDGFIITAGKAQFAGSITDANQDGGGWYNSISGVNVSSPTLLNNIFQGNFAASDGGAMFNAPGAAGSAITSVIQYCKFSHNKADFGGGAITLGSFSVGNYSPQIIECEFTMNEAFRRGGAIYLIGDHALIEKTIFSSNHVTAMSTMGETLPGSGGAVNMVAPNTFFNECIFKQNTTTGNPTGPFEGGGGGAVYMSCNEPQANTLGPSEPRFRNCGFYSNTASGNTAAWGGAAVHLSDAGKLKPSYVNCVFAANQAQDDGGAIANFTRVISVTDGFIPELTPRFTNCTFNQNHAGDQGGALFNDGFVFNSAEILQSFIENCILWDNTASTSGPEVFNTGTNSVAYSLIAGSGGSGGGWNAVIGTDGGNNIDANPLFVNAAQPLGTDNIPANADDGLRLNVTSPATESGNNTAVGLSGITLDFILAPRIQGTQIDMGAYEQIGIVIPELPKDIYWLDEWRNPNPPCLVCPWAFRLRDFIFEEFVWDGKAQLVDDGKTATIKGKIILLKDREVGFNVNLKLVNKKNWTQWNALNRTWYALSLEALLTGFNGHTQWSFFELSAESYLEGTGKLSGKLQLAHYPANFITGFQLGKGANAWDRDFGMAGAFSYKGVLKFRGKEYAVRSTGTMNVDATICKSSCDFTNERLIGTRQFNVQEENSQLKVFPNPARGQFNISLENVNAGKYILKIYNAQGQLKKQEVRILKGSVVEVKIGGLNPGIYFLQVIGESGEIKSKRIVVQ